MGKLFPRRNIGSLKLLKGEKLAGVETINIFEFEDAPSGCSSRPMAFWQCPTELVTVLKPGTIGLEELTQV